MQAAARSSATSAPRLLSAGRSRWWKRGDLIRIDVPGRVLAIVGVKGEEKTPGEIDAILAVRRARWQAKPPKYKKGLLKRYAEHAVSPMKGAYME